MRRTDRGYVMAALLVSLAVMSIMMAVALPAWHHQSIREKEAELIFRGEQYGRAISQFQRKFPGTWPPSIDALVQQRFLRKKYKDPMTEDGEFQIVGLASVAQGQTPGGRSAPVRGGLTPPPSSAFGPGAQPTGTLGAGASIAGVVSKSKEKSIRLYNGRGHYNEWVFMGPQISSRPGGPGGQGRPGAPGVGVPGIGGRDRGGGLGPGTGRGGGRGRGDGRGFGPGRGRGIDVPRLPGRGRGGR
jgi:type II secretory pathway pseudopilin PulG